MVNSIMNVHSDVKFSKTSGSYYYFDGMNLFLANFVKRWRVYRANTAKISVDMLGKAGVGPALPHIHSKLPVNPTDGGQLVFGGWNYGVEAACRVTLFRYGYFELAGKYDYAMLDNLQIYQGNAKQDIASYQVIASIGFTLPTTHLNPLFHKEKRIVTMLPWYNHKDDLKGGKAEKKDDGVAPMDSLGGGVPEFSDIVDKGTPGSNPDSATAMDNVPKEEVPNADTTAAAAEPEKKHSRRWFKRHKKDADTVAAPAAETVAAIPPVTDTPAVAAPPAPVVEPPVAVPVPEPAKDEVKQADKDVLKEAIEGVNFESSKDVIQKSSYVVLDKVVTLMKNNPTYKLQINGHTDNKGSATFNKTLSQKRANAVKKYLTDRGVASSRLKAAGYGGEQPIADNNTDEGKLKNRRVEFIIE
jgi:outer membrane protein OmpA-like peptidoglycan-associated protein